MTSKIAFLAPAGSYGWICAEHIFGQEVMETNNIPCERNEDVVVAIREGRAKYGVVPVENGIQGPVFPVLTELLESHQCGRPIYAIRESIVSVQHCLIGVPGVDITDIETVRSHEQALGQCRKRIREKGYRSIPMNSTSRAVEKVMEDHDITVAAIASKSAAIRYSAEVLIEGFQDRPDNYTRFLALGSEIEDISAPTGDDKLIIAFNLPNHPGTLARIQNLICEAGLNLDFLPVLQDGLGHYQFFAGFNGHQDDSDIRQLLERIQQHSSWCALLGSFARTTEIVE